MISRNRAITFILLAAGLLWVVAELSVRAYYYSRALDPDIYARYHMRRLPLLGFWLQPGLKKLRSRTLSTTFSTNSKGLRGEREYPLPKAPGLARVLCVGASSVFGFGVSGDDSSWPARLERELRATGRAVEVINQGCPGTNSAQALVASALLGLPLEPDLLIFYQGWNDITNYLCCEEEWIDHRILSEESYYSCESWEAYIAGSNPDWPLLRHSAVLFAALRARQKFLPSQGAAKHPQGRARFLANYRNNVRALIDLCRGRGIPVILLPLIGRPSTHAQDQRTDINGVLRELAGGDAKVHFEDLESFKASRPESEEWFVDPYHFSDKACELIGAFLKGPVLELL
ncbi:MAG: hypothetical protein HQL31_06390 [Planctomycetes bacterium]|nr:hypothetical protein [Planctomycetota bacterium]